MQKTTLTEQARKIDTRRAELGDTDRASMPANSGSHRTDSKKALLRAIEVMAREQGRVPPFKANY